MIHYDGAAASHVGQIRKINQDRVLLSGSIAAVADGMGGHAGGEKAAALAIGELSGIRGTISADRFHKVIEAANKRIYDMSSDPSLRGMGTTIVAAVVDAEESVLNIVNVGDSRAYRLRDGALEQLTIDHSLVEDLVREGRLTPEEALTHPQRNIVTRALGINAVIEIDMFVVDAAIGDRFILCSDGLFNEVDDDSIIEILLRATSSDGAANELVDTAVARGGRDNVTVVIVDILDPADETSVFEAVVGEIGQPTPAEEPIDQSGSINTASLADVEGGPEVHFAEPITDEVEPVLAPHEEDTVPAEEAPRKRRWLPFRTSVILTLTVLGVVGFGIGGSAWYARSAYFADDVDGDVVILRGRPGGVLWFEPVTVENTQLSVSALDGASQELLRNRTQWQSLDDARQFVSNLETAPSGSGASDGG